MSDAQQLFKKELMRGLFALDLDSDALFEGLLKYNKLLQKWNNCYNLTAIIDPSKVAGAHFLDSLSVHRFLQGGSCLDIGTGAGFPGAVLALMAPQQQWVLLDSSIKKIRFITQLRAELKLDNVEIVHARAVTYEHHNKFNNIISRALFSAFDLYQNSRHLLGKNGRIFAMKSIQYQSELTALKQQKIAYTVHPIQLPELQQRRYLIEMKKAK